MSTTRHHRFQGFSWQFVSCAWVSTLFRFLRKTHLCQQEFVTFSGVQTFATKNICHVKQTMKTKNIKKHHLYKSLASKRVFFFTLSQRCSVETTRSWVASGNGSSVALRPWGLPFPGRVTCWSGGETTDWSTLWRYCSMFLSYHSKSFQKKNYNHLTCSQHPNSHLSKMDFLQQYVLTKISKANSPLFPPQRLRQHPGPRCARATGPWTGPSWRGCLAALFCGERWTTN